MDFLMLQIVLAACILMHSSTCAAFSPGTFKQLKQAVDTCYGSDKQAPSTAVPMYHDPNAGIVAFYSEQNEYGFLSNFFFVRFRLRGVYFDYSEQAIIYCKASLMGDKDSLEKLKEPGLPPKHAKALGRKITPWKPKLWDAEVRNIAFEVLMAKFSQNPKIAAKLEKTGNKRLVQAAANDIIWGAGMNASQVMTGTPFRGQNILGNTLERVRASLRKDRANGQGMASLTFTSGSKTKTVQSKSRKGKPASQSRQPATPSVCCEVIGDMINSEEDYIVHQTNCVTKTSAGLSRVLFNKFPFADCYRNRTTSDEPGTIDIRGDGQSQRYVVNLHGQVQPGKCKRSGPDSPAMRLTYFQRALNELAHNIANGGKPEVTVAFPYAIGCGMAGGDWNKYSKAIEEFEKNVNALNVVRVQVKIYRLPPRETKRSDNKVEQQKREQAQGLGVS